MKGVLDVIRSHWETMSVIAVITDGRGRERQRC